MVNVNCTGGGGYFSDDVSATKAQVVAGKTTVTKDQGDEVVEGTMVDVSATDVQQTNTIANNNLYLRMTNGVHRKKNTTSGYPEVYIPLNTLRSTIGATDASKILTGTTIAGLAGTMKNNNTWNGTLERDGQVTIPQGWHNGSGKVTRPFATYGGGTFTPSASDQIIPTSGKILTGDVKCKADTNLIASNLRHGVSIMGVTGTYFSPTLYDGGSAAALFGNTYTAKFRQSGASEEGGGASGFDLNTMQGWVLYDFALSTSYQGYVCVLSSKLFDISHFNSLTCTYTTDAHPTYPNYYYVICSVGMTDSTAHSNGYLQGKQYTSSEVYNYGGQKSVTLDLTKAKAAGQNFYPFVEFGIGHEASYDVTMNFRINSLIFS